MKIVTVDRNTLDEILPLIAAYQRFYECVPNEDKNRAYFARFTEDHSQGILFGAFNDEEEAIGFSTLYFVPSTLSA
jgi:hypothetical protein